MIIKNFHIHIVIVFFWGIPNILFSVNYIQSEFNFSNKDKQLKIIIKTSALIDNRNFKLQLFSVSNNENIYYNSLASKSDNSWIVENILTKIKGNCMGLKIYYIKRKIVEDTTICDSNKIFQTSTATLDSLSLIKINSNELDSLTITGKLDIDTIIDRKKLKIKYNKNPVSKIDIDNNKFTLRIPRDSIYSLPDENKPLTDGKYKNLKLTFLYNGFNIKDTTILGKDIPLNDTLKLGEIKLLKYRKKKSTPKKKKTITKLKYTVNFICEKETISSYTDSTKEHTINFDNLLSTAKSRDTTLKCYKPNKQFWNSTIKLSNNTIITIKLDSMYYKYNVNLNSNNNSIDTTISDSIFCKDTITYKEIFDNVKKENSLLNCYVLDTNKNTTLVLNDTAITKDTVYIKRKPYKYTAKFFIDSKQITEMNSVFDSTISGSIKHSTILGRTKIPKFLFWDKYNLKNENSVTSFLPNKCEYAPKIQMEKFNYWNLARFSGIVYGAALWFNKNNHPTNEGLAFIPLTLGVIQMFLPGSWYGNNNLNTYIGIAVGVAGIIDCSGNCNFFSSIKGKKEGWNPILPALPSQIPNKRFQFRFSIPF